jgi:hypothetical protein
MILTDDSSSSAALCYLPLRRLCRSVDTGVATLQQFVLIKGTNHKTGLHTRMHDGMHT